MRVSSTEIQNNFGKYLNLAKIGEEVIVTRNGKDVAKLIPSKGESIISEEAALYFDDNDDLVTYEEFLKLVGELKHRYELIDGRIYNLPCPNFDHQEITSELIGIFRRWFKGKKCRALAAPFDITLVKSEDNINVVQPDIVVICDTENIDDKRKYNGVPTLVVEVLSKSTRSKDMIIKLNLYMKTGIREYWVVDPISQLVQIFHFNDSNIEEHKVFKNNEMIKSIYFSGLHVDANDLFAFLND